MPFNGKHEEQIEVPIAWAKLWKPSMETNASNESKIPKTFVHFHPICQMEANEWKKVIIDAFGCLQMA